MRRPHHRDPDPSSEADRRRWGRCRTHEVEAGARVDGLRAPEGAPAAREVGGRRP
jgi:hypothetical protein